MICILPLMVAVKGQLDILRQAGGEPLEIDFVGIHPHRLHKPP